MNISVDKLSDEIKQYLDEMSLSCTEQMNEAAEETAKDTADELKTTSPVRKTSKGGAYAKNWDYKLRETDVLKNDHYTVYNKKPTYRLTHLLEYGHIIKSTGRRAKAIAHIKPAEEKASEEFIKKVEEMKL